MDETYSVFETGWGWMGVVRGTGGIRRIVLPSPRRENIVEQIRASFCDAVPVHAEMGSLIKQIQDYFDARRLSFSVDLDWSGHPAFSVAVWKGAQAIPPGDTKTYQWLGRKIGRPHGQRAVGGALGRNPFPLVVPCHRVVRSDGALGGFSAPGGVALKQRLLEHEGVMFDGNGRVKVSER